MRKKNKNNNENAQMQDMNTVQMDGANAAFAANVNFSGAILQDAEAMETLTEESGKKSKKAKKALAKKEKAKKKKEEYIEKKGLLGNADDYHVYHMKPVDTLTGYLMGVAAVAAGAYIFFYSIPFSIIAGAIAGFFSIKLYRKSLLKIALALAESAYDLNQLCLGKSVPLYKSSTTWAMSPQGMINVTKETAATLIGKATEAAEKNLNDAITNVFDKIENTANDKISEIGDTIGIYMTQTIRDVSDKVINATVTPFMNGIKGVLGKIDSSWGKDKIKEELQNCLDKLKEGSTDDIYGQAKTVAIEYLEGKIDEVAGTICDGLKDAAGNKSDIIGKVNALFKKVDPETNTETGYIVDLNDQIAKKITDLSGELQGKVSEALNSTEDNVKEELNEALNNFSDGISEKVSSGLDKVGESAPDSKTVGDVSNAKAATISLNYKEYLYAFMLIGILANEDNMVARTGYLMQMNISQKMTDAGFNDSDRENFDMTKMYTMVQIHSEADVDSVFMGMFEKKTVNGEESYSLNFDGDGSSTDRLVYNGFIGY